MAYNPAGASAWRVDRAGLLTCSLDLLTPSRREAMAYCE